MRWILAISATVLVGFAAPAADPLSRTDLDKRLSKLVFETVTSGVDLYNAGNYEGCYRLYQGSLSAIVPLLDHKPKLAESVANQLAKAKKETATDGAFTPRSTRLMNSTEQSTASASCSCVSFLARRRPAMRCPSFF